ncbi:MAG: tetratricopeptide repeat protein [Candidatus Omnitrophica bacterium]|nr:tetratricopeptide repeat protein [Candidatus Omnitrophota bacterium]
MNIYHLGQTRKSMLIIEYKLESNQELCSYELKSGIEYFLQLLDMVGPIGSTYGNLGFCYYYLGDQEKAIKMYDKAIELDSERYTYWMDLGIISFNSKLYDKAISCFEKAFELIPGVPFYYLTMAEDFSLPEWQSYILNSMPEAVIQSEKDAQLVCLRMAQSYYYLGQMDKAREAVTKGIMIASSKRGNLDYLENFKYFAQYEGKKGLLDKDLTVLLHFDYTLNRVEVVMRALTKASGYSSVK